MSWGDRVTDWSAQIEQVCRELTDRYVFPEVARRVAEGLRTRLAEGGYAGLTGPAELAEVVTADLQRVNGDPHLRLRYHVDPLPDGDPAAGTYDPEVLRAQGELDGFGIASVLRLPGNVGCLETTLLYPPELAGAALSGAMSLLAHTDALLLDVRGNGGGSPGAVALLCTYLLDERTHLNDIYSREGDRTDQVWTTPYAPGPHFGGTKPVWVLTGPDTFSGAEDLAYTLQQLGRARTVGEPSRGGAHPRGQYKVDTHLDVTVPVARSINPVSGTNWEGTGVRPDVPVPAATAHDHAYRLALEHVLTLGGTGRRRPVAEQARAALAGLGKPSHG